MKKSPLDPLNTLVALTGLSIFILILTFQT